MANITRRGKTWRASVYKQGTRKTATFDTKAEAVAWAAKIEHELNTTRKGDIPNKTFAELMVRYQEHVSVNKPGYRWEEIRINAVKQSGLGRVRLTELAPSHFAEWRDERLKTVSGSTVLRELKLLTHACNVAVKEWGWLHENPISSITRPKESPPRDRLISPGEIERVLFACGYDYEATPQTALSRVGAAFLFAIETAMRAGEIAALSRNLVDFDKQIATLLTTKNGKPRKVPLSKEAIRILKQLPANEDLFFNLNADQISSLFRKTRERTLIENLHFHDTRHEAITRLAKKLDVLDLARMTGHMDLKMLMVYYNETAEELAKKLD